MSQNTPHRRADSTLSSKQTLPSERRRRLFRAIEPLEARWLLAFTTFADGVFTVNGTAADDTIALTIEGDNLVATLNGTPESVAAGDVTSVVVTAKGGNDLVTLGAGVRFAQVAGDSGNDTLVSGDGDDTLAGGAGNDTYQFHDGWGNDVVFESEALGTDTMDFSAATRNLLFSIGVLIVNDGQSTANHGENEIENLIAGSGNDSFLFQPGAVLNGTIAGGAGSNSLVYRDYNGAVTVDLGAGTATGTNGVSGFSNVVGGSQADQLTGNAEANSLDGGPGNDTIVGGGGADTFVYGDNGGTDQITGIGAGASLDFSGYTTALTFNINVTGVSVVSNGNVIAEAGNDLARLAGGLGNDTFVFENAAEFDGALAGDGGSNTLDYSAYTTGITVDLAAGTSTGTGGIQGFTRVVGSNTDDSISGSESADTLTGGAGNDTIVARGGADQLFGSAGNDSLNGGGGNDTYHFTDAWGTDTVTEAADNGTDTLNFTLVTTNLQLTVGTGAIAGNQGNAVTQSDADAENFIGGSGNDTAVFNTGDQIVGTLDGGDGTNSLDYSADTADASVDLVAGTATGTGGIQGFTLVTGGSGNDSLCGSDAANTLVGGAGNDTLLGRGGADQLTGGAGNDSLDGGAGNDSYSFADAWGSDTVLEAANGGTDTLDFAQVTSNLRLTVDTGDIIDNLANALAQSDANAENVTFGAGNDTAIFNTGAQITALVGGAGANKLDYTPATAAVNVNLNTSTAAGITGSFTGFDHVTGGAGNDTLVGNANTNTLLGGRGNDNIDAREGNDSVRGGAGNDTLKGLAGNDTIRGDAGDDLLRGGAGNDSVVGGVGNDRIYGDAGLDSLLGSGGNDTIYSRDRARDIVKGEAGTDKARIDQGTDIVSGVEELLR